MKILLTGGAGYIGSHIAVELAAAGFEAVIADNFSNSSPDAIDKITAITGKPTQCVELDMTDREAVARLFGDNDFAAVVHLAGFKAVGESVEKPLMYYRNNLDCTLTLLEAMERRGAGKLIFSSSATVYGSSATPPYTEDMELGVCPNPYGATKQMIERIIADVASRGRVSSVILRYFNPVGAHPSGLLRESPRGASRNRPLGCAPTGLK
jgi:UDP-glucose 4-epimerase